MKTIYLPNAVLIGDLNMLRSFTDKISTILLTKNKPSTYSRWYKKGQLISNTTDMLSHLVELGRKELQSGNSAPVLFYGEDDMLMLISKNRKELHKYYKFNMPDHEIVEACTDKQKFVELADKHNLLVPKQIASSDIETIVDIVGEIPFPVIIKPASHIGWHNSEATKHIKGNQKMLVAGNLHDLDNILNTVLKHTNDFVVQQYIHGEEDCIYSFHTYSDKHARPYIWYVGKKIRTYPSIGGESTYLELIHDSDVVKAGLDIVQDLQIKGPVKIDFKRDSVTGKLYLLELNLRFNLWNYLGTANGINLPEIAYHDLTGRMDEYPLSFYYKTDTKWITFYGDVRAFLDYRSRGLLTTWQWIKSLMSKKVCDVWSWRDPLPFIIYNTTRIKRKLFK